MISHRIQEFCSELNYHLSYNSTGDLCCGGKVCAKPIHVCTSTPDLWEGEETGWVYQILSCGHSRLIPQAKALQYHEQDVLWDNLLPFQRDYVQFVEDNVPVNGRIVSICRDRMGLGKTAEALSVYRRNASLFTDNNTKYCVIITPVGGVYQWEEESLRWLGLNGNAHSIEHLMLQPQVVVVPNQKLTPIAKTVIIPWSRIGDKTVLKQLKEIGIGSLIVDEAHFFKDEKAARTTNLINLIRLAGNKAPLLFLSGTMVENCIMELKVALNACDPTRWYSWEAIDRVCLHDQKGKAYGIHPYWRDRFFQWTKSYMIGRTKDQARIPLPPFKREVVWDNPSNYSTNKELIQNYNEVLDKLEVCLAQNVPDSGSIIGLMQQLRHYTGLMKIMGAAIFIEEWIRKHPTEKLAVGIHHKIVRTSLAEILKEHNPLQMSDEDAKEKDEIERAFRNGKSNLLICSILSAGVGRNLQFCKNCIIVERQWNKSKEEQFEERFHRITTDEQGKVKLHFSEKDTVTSHYYQMEDTFDEYFDKLVDLKAIIVDSSDESVEDIPSPQSILDLARLVVEKRREYVGM